MTLTAAIVAAHDHATALKGYGVGAGMTDCVVAAQDTLAGVYGARVNSETAALRVWDHSNPWSVLDAVERLGIATELDDAPTRGRWHICQGWRRLNADGSVPSGGGVNGHVWLWWEPPHAGPGRLLEANIRRPWDRSLTWGEQRAPYTAGVRLAVLVDPFERDARLDETLEALTIEHTYKARRDGRPPKERTDD